MNYCVTLILMGMFSGLALAGHETKTEDPSINQLHDLLLNADTIQLRGSIIAWNEDNEELNKVYAVSNSKKVLTAFADWLVAEPWNKLPNNPSNFASGTLVEIVLSKNQTQSARFLVYAGCISFNKAVFEQGEDCHLSVSGYLRKTLNQQRHEWRFK